MSDTSIVKTFAAAIKKTRRRGPTALRTPAVFVHHLRGIGHGRNTFTPGDIYRELTTEDAQNRVMWRRGVRGQKYMAYPTAKRLFKRAMKKAAQPYRKNKNRKRMQRRASGKNEVRP